MPTPCHAPGRSIHFCLMAVLCLHGLWLTAEEHLLSSAELGALDRQNQMWRLVRTEEDVTVNLRAWRAAGFTGKEVEGLKGQLIELWTVKAERNYGWLNAEVVEKVQAVDLEFIARMRAARLHEAVGIRSGAHTVAEVNVQWRRAILRVLEDDELSEFRLMNSAPAREIDRLLEGILRSTGEDRQLFQLERDFDNAYGTGFSPGPRSRDPQWREAWLDHLAAIRLVLGDDRFVLYLGRADPDFDEMSRTLCQLASVPAGTTLDLWWLRQQQAITRTKKRLAGREWSLMVAATRLKAEEMLGVEILHRYMKSDGARWLWAR